MNTTQQHPRPLPEAITGTPWTVVFTAPSMSDSGHVAIGSTTPAEHRMALPLDAAPDDGGRYTTLHELAHAKWTPSGASPHKLAKKHKCTVADLQFAEDFRITTLLHRARLIPPNMRTRSDETTKQAAAALAELAKRGQLYPIIESLTFSRLQRLAASLDRTEHPMTATPLTNEHRQMLAIARATVDENMEAARTLETAVSAAQNITREAAKKVYRRKTKRSPLPFALTPKLAAEIRRLLDQYRELNEAPIDNKPPQQNGEGKFGTLRKLPPLPLTIAHRPDATKTPTRKAALAGTRIGSLRRLLTDGRAFRRTIKPKIRGGTVLIDASGSMHLEQAHLREILAAAPAATVAMYSGDDTQGAVTIIAQRGRMASDAEIAKRREAVGRGNIVDGPALAWLAEQQEPRIWICDGIVTGEYDKNTHNLKLEAALLAKRGRITRHASPAHYFETIQQEGNT